MSWTCDDCGVRISFAEGFEAPAAPAGWAATVEGWRCLRCRWEHERAKLDALDTTDAAEHLIGFELRRCPADTATKVATRLRGAGLRVGNVSPHLVGIVRAKLIREGALAPPVPVAPASREAVEAELRSDPRRTDSAIATIVGRDRSTVGRARRRLEAAGAIECWRPSRRKAAA